MAVRTRITRSTRMRTTISHGEIRHWAEDRGGRPAAARGTGDLRIEFGDLVSGEPISWEDFFLSFEDNDLAFVHLKDEPSQQSRFYKIVPRKNSVIDDHESPEPHGESEAEAVEDDEEEEFEDDESARHFGQELQEHEQDGGEASE